MNSLTLAVDIVVRNQKALDTTADKVERLDKTAGNAAPKAEKLGGGINVATLAAGAAALAVGALTGAVGSYVKSALDAAARTEGLRNGLRTVVPNAEEFEATLLKINRAARLPGLQKNDLIRFTTNLRASGLDADQTEKALTILGSRIVGFGQTSAEAAQVVGQFSQAMGRNAIQGDELNRLYESLPGLKNLVVEMTGVTGGADDLNKAFAAQGKTVQEGIIPLLEAYDASLGEINHDAALVKTDAFEGALEDLRNTIGQQLLPVYKDLLDFGANLADGFSALLTGSQDLPQPLKDFAAAGQGLIDALEPLLEPLKELGNAILPLLQTYWENLVGFFTEFLIPTYAKMLSAISPVTEALIKLAIPIINLVKTYMPPLRELLQGIATTIIDIVLVPLSNLAGAFAWVIDKITDLINLIPGAKTELESQAEAHKSLTDQAQLQSDAMSGLVEDQKALKEELKGTKTELDAAKKAFDAAKVSGEGLAEAAANLSAAQEKHNEVTELLKGNTKELESREKDLNAALAEAKTKTEEAETALLGAKAGTEAAEEAAITYKQALADEKSITELLTDEIKSQTTEIPKAAAETQKFSDIAATTAKKQTELKVAVAATSIELKNAQQALKDATNPEEIEAASERVKKAIEAVKAAKVAEASSFDEGSKKQIALLKAESEAQTAHEKVVETSTKNREKYAEDLTKKEEDAAKDRELAIENEVNALSTLITNYTQSTQTEFEARTAAFRSYKDKRIALSDEVIRNIEASEMTEAEKAAAIRKTHEELAKDLSTEWKKITAAEKAELEAQTKQAADEAKAKAEAIKAQNDEILNQTEAYLIRAETAYKGSFDRSEKEQDDAFDRLLVSLTTHHAAELKASEDKGEDTAVLRAKQDAEIEKLQDAHHTRLQKQNDAEAKAEQKAQKKALDELKSLEKGFFDAVSGATQDFHSDQVVAQRDFNLDWNAAAQDGLQVFKDEWADAFAEIVDLGLQYIKDMKAVNEIQIEAEQQKHEIFAELSEAYFEIEREAVEKLRELAQERVKIYEDAKTAIEQALEDHETRLVDIEKDYNDRVIEINEDAVAQLKEIGIDSHRDRLDDTLDFHDELQSIEDAAQQKREGAAEDHEKRLADIANERNKDLLGASRDFVGESLEAFETFQSALGSAEGTQDVFGANDRLNQTVGRQLQGLLRSVIGDEADALFSVEGFDAFEFLGISGANNLTSDDFIQALTSSLPDTINRLRSGELLGASDAQAASLAELLGGTSVNDATGGILGAFRDAGTAEDARYLEVLDGINEWEIAANEVILNTQSLIIQAGVDRGDAETASLTLRDDTTQAIAEGQNQAQAGITGQEIEIKQSVQDALDQFFIDYANAALTIDAETRAAIKAAQKQAADSFWGSVIEIGGTVLGVAAGAAVSGLTGGAIPPNIAIGLGAQLGQAGGGLLADAVVGGDDDALFHYHETDRIAKRSGLRSGRATKTQMENAEDFSKYFGEGFTSTFGAGDTESSATSVREMIVNAEKVFIGGDDIGDILKNQLSESASETDTAMSDMFEKGISALERLEMGLDPSGNEFATQTRVPGLGFYPSTSSLSLEEWTAEMRRRTSDPLATFFEDNPWENAGVSISELPSVLQGGIGDYNTVANILQAYKNAQEDFNTANDGLIGSFDSIIEEILERSKTIAGLHRTSLNQLVASGGGYGNALFHYPETDWIARDISRSEELRQGRERPYFADQNQIRNARDVAREISAGVQEAMNTNNRGGLGGQQESVNLNLTLILDSDQVVTPRFAEAVSDQLSINEQSSGNRR